MTRDPDFDEIVRIISYIGNMSVQEFHEFWVSLSLEEKQGYKARFEIYSLITKSVIYQGTMDDVATVFRNTPGSLRHYKVYSSTQKEPFTVERFFKIYKLTAVRKRLLEMNRRIRKGEDVTACVDTAATEIIDFFEEM